jgi:hypothetical protein
LDLVDALLLNEFSDVGDEDAISDAASIDAVESVDNVETGTMVVESEVQNETQVGSMSPEESEEFWKTRRRGLRRRSK